jgi:hypothetical protein
MDWLKQSWGYLVLGGGLLATAIVAVRAVYAAERDRKALEVAHLEREKLELEVARLRNSPEVVADRRAIYDKLRQLVHEIIRDASVDISELAALHELKHESEYRYPTEVVAAMGTLIQSAVMLLWSNKELQLGPHQVGAAEWPNVVKSNSDALLDVLAFEQSMVDRFRPYLML